MRKLSMFVVGGLALIASAAAQSAKLYGVWDFPDTEDNGITFKSSLTFAHNVAQNYDEITQFVKCSTEEKSAEARVTTKVKIRDGEYEVIEEASDSETTDELPCVSTIHAGTVGYKVADDGSQLDLTLNGESVELERRN
jgi:hypothetical protein